MYVLSLVFLLTNTPLPSLFNPLLSIKIKQCLPNTLMATERKELMHSGISFYKTTYKDH